MLYRYWGINGIVVCLVGEVASSFVCFSEPGLTEIKSRRGRWTEHVAQEGIREVHEVIIGRLEGNKTLQRPRSRWG
jgi:hypothetical protein